MQWMHMSTTFATWMGSSFWIIPACLTVVEALVWRRTMFTPLYQDLVVLGKGRLNTTLLPSVPSLDNQDIIVGPDLHVTRPLVPMTPPS